MYNLHDKNESLAQGYSNRVLRILVPDPAEFQKHWEKIGNKTTEELFLELQAGVTNARNTWDDTTELDAAFALVETIVSATEPVSPDGLVPWIAMPNIVGLTLDEVPQEILHFCEVKYLYGSDSNTIVHQSVDVGFKFPAEGWKNPSGKCHMVIGFIGERADYYLKDGVPTPLQFYTVDHGEGKYTVDCKKNMTYEQLTEVFDEAVADFTLKDGKNWTEVYNAFEEDVHSWYDILTDMENI